jgi:hypothetical protein
MALLVALMTADRPVYAVNLGKIDRTIGKEPKYQWKPQYCLVVLGPEAKTRVWLVLDGNVLYASGKDCELTKVVERSEEEEGYVVRVPGIAHGMIVRAIRNGDAPDLVKVAYRPDGLLAQRQTIEGNVQFGDAPKTAPVVHLDGSYTSTLRERGVIEKGKWLRDADEYHSALHVYIGSNVLQKEGKAFVRTWWSFPSDKVRPIAEIEFPNQDPRAEPIKARVPLVFR